MVCGSSALLARRWSAAKIRPPRRTKWSSGSRTQPGPEEDPGRGRATGASKTSSNGSLHPGHERRPLHLDVDGVAVEPQVGPGRDVVRDRLLAGDGASAGRPQVVGAAVELAVGAVGG